MSDQQNSLQQLTVAFQKLLKDSSKKHAALRKACQDALGSCGY
jgi:hypothetical protein